MAFVIKYIADQIFQTLENRDTRLDHLPLTSPLSAILVLASYVYFVKKCGPTFMSQRKPFLLREVIIVYDLIQIVLNGALFFYAIYSWFFYKSDFNFACQPVDWGTEEIAIQEAESVYYFYCLKLFDLCDTVFFILRKKDRQVTFLHVYHHVAVVTATYKILGWSAGGHFIICGLFNSFVHTFMYLYYFCSVYKPELKNNIEVKKAMTKLQMIQFLFMIYFFGRPLLVPGCSVPKIFLFEIVFTNSFLLILFSSFYYKNYYRK